MSQCNQNCNQGRDCDCRPSLHDKSDKYVKWLLLFAALYFLGHFFASVAQAQPSPTVPAPVVQCWSNGMGTIQCIQI
jgi:hypothetical protein